jgi:nitroreductase
MKTSKIIEAIEQRKSVRSYSGEPLSKEHAGSILHFIAGLEAPFGASIRIDLIRTNISSTERIKLGTYGIIRGASDFLTLVFEEGPLAKESAAYAFEQVILFCTGLGLGTCWFASFSRKDFNRQLNLNTNEKVGIVSPVGYENAKKGFIESLMGSEGKHRSRKPFGTLFFHHNFDTPLTEELAGIYRKPLEMVRLAPSANNQQPWRIVLGDGILHFYRHSSPVGFTSIDTGIALCHFEQTCKELNIQGKFAALDNVPERKGDIYVLSWLANL